MKSIVKKDEYGYKIGTWASPISIGWRKNAIFRWYGIRFFDKYNEVCFGRLEIRIWKPKFLRTNSGIYFFREMPHDNSGSL